MQSHRKLTLVLNVSQIGLACLQWWPAEPVCPGTITAMKKTERQRHIQSPIRWATAINVHIWTPQLLTLLSAASDTILASTQCKTEEDAEDCKPVVHLSGWWLLVSLRLGSSSFGPSSNKPMAPLVAVADKGFRSDPQLCNERALRLRVKIV